jgi:hypothetical protein
VNHADLVTLREHLEKVIELRFAAMEKAVQLAAKTDSEHHAERAGVLERHLDALNHAHSQAVKDREQFLRADVYAAEHDKVSTRIVTLERDINQRFGPLEKIATVAIFIAATLPIALNIVMRLLEKPRP